MTNIDIKESEPTTDLQIPSKDSNTIITERQRPEVVLLLKYTKRDIQ